MPPKRRLGARTTLGFLALHGAAAYGALRLVEHPSWRIITLGLALWVLAGLGLSAGYHRLLTHRSFRVGPGVNAVLVLLGGMAFQGPALFWVLIHQLHHDYEDRPGLDPHTPLEYGGGWKGFLWAHVGWILCDYQLPLERRPETCLGSNRFAYLKANRAVMLLSGKWYLVPAIATFAIPGLIGGWDGLFAAGFLRVVLSLHFTYCVNSVCHKWGNRATDSLGKVYRIGASCNNLVISLLTFGEGNHDRHHVRPKWAYHGWKWYHWDPTKWLLMVLESLQLVTIAEADKPDHNVVFAAKQLGITQLAKPA